MKHGRYTAQKVCTVFDLSGERCNKAVLYMNLRYRVNSKTSKSITLSRTIPYGIPYLLL